MADAFNVKNRSLVKNPTNVIGQGLLDILQGGEKPRAILGGLLGGDTSALSGAWNEVKQLADPNYMRNIKGINSTEAMDIALNANPVIAATFIGKGAKTWDAVAHSKALEMAKKGIDERKIWAKTGTFKGADGQWRQEISDHEASMNSFDSLRNAERTRADEKIKQLIKDANGMPTPMQKMEMAAMNKLKSTDSYQGYVKDALNHNELNKAYPSIAETRFKWMDMPSGDMGEFSKNGVALSKSVNGDEAKSIFNHENQHIIQDLEGWGLGGSPEAMREEALSMLRRDVTSGEIGSTEQAMAMLPDAQLNAYRRLAGEAEARATQARMNLTPQERLAKFPFDSYDVPRESLIVRGLLGDGEKAMSTMPDYGIQHRPPMKDNGGAPLNDLTGGGNVYPDDIYSPQAVQYYGTGERKLDATTIAKIKAYKDKPDVPITMYRAVGKEVPDNAVINNGDWVTINPDYAKQHGESALNGEYKILQQQVPARKLFTNGDSIHEFGYDQSGKIDPRLLGLISGGGLLGLGAYNYGQNK